MEGPPARGSGLYPLRRQISAARQVRLLYPLPIFRAGSSTDQNSWPTPNRCEFNSRTAHHAGLARRSSPRSITARGWFDSSVTHQNLRDWQIWICTRLLSESKWVRFLPRSPAFNQLADFPCRFPAVPGQTHNPPVRFGHVRRVCRSILIHGGSHVRVSHELLLHAHGSSPGIQPSAVCVPETVSARHTGFLKHSPHLIVRPRRPAKL